MVDGNVIRVDESDRHLVRARLEKRRIGGTKESRKESIWVFVLLKGPDLLAPTSVVVLNT